jgi:hypothetical protein
MWWYWGKNIVFYTTIFVFDVTHEGTTEVVQVKYETVKVDMMVTVVWDLY